MGKLEQIEKTKKTKPFPQNCAGNGSASLSVQKSWFSENFPIGFFWRALSLL
jgi:hypothetical protein